jgi:hypothetical protein
MMPDILIREVPADVMALKNLARSPSKTTVGTRTAQDR